MAQTTATTVTEAIYAAIIESVFKEELGAAVVVAPLVRYHDLSGEASLAWKVIKNPATPTVTDLAADTDDLTTGTAYTPTQVTISATEAGVLHEVTQRALEGTVLQEALMAEIGSWMTRAVARELDSDLCGLFSSFATSVGTTGASLDESDWLEAIYNLELNNAGMPIVAVLHPALASQMRKAMSLVATAGTSLATAAIKQSMDMAAIGKSNAGAGGLWTDIYNVPCYLTTEVILSTDRHGAMMNAGQAIGLAGKYFGKVEYQRDISKRSTEICVSSMYGVGEIEDLQGVRLVGQNTA